MAALHTPGPWHRDAASGYGCDVRAANGRKIAAVAGLRQPATTKEGLREQRAVDHANACLIAAAPDLLPALKELHRVCSAMDLEHEANRPSEAEYIDAMEVAQAAIAKATGESPVECTCAAKDMPFGRCCKATGSAT
jgi:hypothetical protein